MPSPDTVARSAPINARVHEYLTRLSQTYVVTQALRDEALSLADEVEQAAIKGLAARGAGRLGISVEEYTTHLEANERWCAGCHAWHDRAEFGRSRGRREGRNPVCRAHARKNQRRRDQSRQKAGAA